MEDFLKDFESRFSELLKDPSNIYTSRERYLNYYRWHDEPPTKKFSDWDLCCWLNVNKISTENLRDIDRFIRTSSKLSDVGLFSKPNRDEEHLQYMAYSSNEDFAPFLDLNLRGPFRRSQYEEIYDPIKLEHKRWTYITVWRKIKNNEIDTKYGAIKTYREHNHGYWPTDDIDEIILDPKSYYNREFPGQDAPKVLIQ